MIEVIEKQQKDICINIRKFINRLNDVYEKSGEDLLIKDDEEFLVNMELHFARAILNDFPLVGVSKDNTAVKVAKIILACAGEDNCIHLEIR